MGRGSANLLGLLGQNPRQSIGGYFQERLPSPYSMRSLKSIYFCCPQMFNVNVPSNIELLAGDPPLELQSNAIATLANAQIPGTDI